jgi:glutathione peroxidase-family protein
MSMLKTLSMYLRRGPRRAESKTDLYEHEVPLLSGGTLDLRELRGKPTLIVNTASKCGFTPQYEGLQNLYDTYGERGLQVLGCPSGDFADQELGEPEEISAFCSENYGVSFTLTGKLSVRAKPHPLWADLARQPGSSAPSWNFAKYLVGADGHLIARWGTKTKPEAPEITAAIERALD